MRLAIVDGLSIRVRGGVVQTVFLDKLVVTLIDAQGLRDLHIDSKKLRDEKSTDHIVGAFYSLDFTQTRGQEEPAAHHRETLCTMYVRSNHIHYIFYMHVLGLFPLP